MSEDMAFTLILEKLAGLEQAMQQLPPLLARIIDQLEAQSTQATVPVAAYDQLYPELQAKPAPLPVTPLVLAPAKRARLRWFTRD